MDMVPKFIMNSGELVRAAAPPSCPTHVAIRTVNSQLQHTLLSCMGVCRAVHKQVQALVPGWLWPVLTPFLVWAGVTRGSLLSSFQCRGRKLFSMPFTKLHAPVQVRVLVHTDVTKYLEFKGVDGSYVLNKGRVEKVPATDYEALRSPLLGLFEKRRLRSFLLCVPALKSCTPLRHCCCL